jgi:hypothetical protein
VSGRSSKPTAQEFWRKERVLDQSITGHAFLRDLYERRALLLTLLILALSIAATATAFLAGDTPVTIVGIRARTQVWVGLLTSLIFFLSLVDLRVDWRQRAGAHGEAVRRLGRVKAIFRGVTIVDDEVDATGVDLDFEYESAMDQVPPIPEKWFLRAKAKHLRKVAASQLLSSHPGAPAWLMKLRVTWIGMRGKSSRPD